MQYSTKRSTWSFGTREVVYAAIGAALYGAIAALTNLIPIPGAANVSFRPGVSIVFLFGLAFGPIVGFIAGFLGNILADLLSASGGFWFWWHLGNGLMGLVAGLFASRMTTFKASRDLITAEVAVILGAAIGMFVASISEMWVSGLDFVTAITANFFPAFLTNIVNGLILVPILLIAYSAIVQRSGR